MRYAISFFLPLPALPKGEEKDFVNHRSTHLSPMEKVAE